MDEGMGSTGGVTSSVDGLLACKEYSKSENTLKGVAAGELAMLAAHLFHMDADSGVIRLAWDGTKQPDTLARFFEIEQSPGLDDVESPHPQPPDLLLAVVCGTVVGM